jgi:tRNA(Ile2) C34 agmatinyltransferase TiaS
MSDDLAKLYLMELEIQSSKENGANELVSARTSDLICALGAFHSRIYRKIESIRPETLHPKLEIESHSCELCGESMMNENIRGWICRNRECELNPDIDSY